MAAYSERCKANGVRLEVNWWKGGTKKKGCWRKKVDGKQRYFFFPDTKDGYQQALLALAQLKARIDLNRPNADVFQHHKMVFQRVKAYYDHFGVPLSDS